MQSAAPTTFTLATEDETTRFGQVLAQSLTPGDVVLLEGSIGAGKTHLARAVIRALTHPAEEVPSPTFTLVQTYDTRAGALWHADLYRLSHPDEVWELGLDDAFASAISLIEWPDRLGAQLPGDAIRISLRAAGEGRQATLAAPDRPGLVAMLSAAFPVATRPDLAQAFVEGAGWGDAARSHLAGDASERSYQRLSGQQGSAILMDAPPGRGDPPEAFVSMANHLRGLGLSAPAILAQDLRQGFLLLEDLGDSLYARHLVAHPEDELPLYTVATDVLTHLQGHPPPPGLSDLTAAEWAEAAMLATAWYRLAITGDRGPEDSLRQALTAALAAHADGPRVLILRDYHAENLIWLPERAGLARAGLLDFQLGQMGQPGYDLVSLLQDARRDVSAGTEAAMIERFAAHLAEPDQFGLSYAVLGAQRALRILGIFARLCLVAGKAQYLPLLPRVWAHLQRNLAHPALADLAQACAALLPEPTPDAQQRIAQQCGRFASL